MSRPLFEYSFKVPTTPSEETIDVKSAYFNTGFPFSPETSPQYTFDLRLNSQKDLNAYVLGRKYLHPFFHKKLRLPEFSKISCLLWYEDNVLLKPYFEYLYCAGDGKSCGGILWVMTDPKPSKCSLVKVFDKEKMELVRPSPRSSSCRSKKARIEDFSSCFSVSLGLVTEDVYLSTSSAR